MVLIFQIYDRSHLDVNHGNAESMRAGAAGKQSAGHGLSSNARYKYVCQNY